MFLFIIIPNFSFLPSRTVSKIKPASLKKNLKKTEKKIFFLSPHCSLHDPRKPKIMID